MVSRIDAVGRKQDIGSAVQTRFIFVLLAPNVSTIPMDLMDNIDLLTRPERG
jgi:hypothetical protein